MMGIPKASVLPEPVGAVPRMSELGADINVLIVSDCIGVGFMKPWVLSGGKYFSW